MNNRLFVYGTLRLGCPNRQAQLLAESTRFIGPARVRGQLFRVTHYPALGPAVLPGDWVKGDLFEGVTPLLFQQLDEYEGAEYSRVVEEVTLENGQKLAANVYSYVLPLHELKLIRSGDWLSSALESQIDAAPNQRKRRSF